MLDALNSLGGGPEMMMGGGHRGQVIRIRHGGGGSFGANARVNNMSE